MEPFKLNRKKSNQRIVSSNNFKELNQKVTERLLEKYKPKGIYNIDKIRYNKNKKKKVA